MASKNVLLQPNGDVWVYPEGDTNFTQTAKTTDVQNITDAVQMTTHGVVLLKCHKLGDLPTVITPFNFGGDAMSTNTIYLTKNVTITGEAPVRESDPKYAGRIWGVAQGTTIKGGRFPFIAGIGIGAGGSSEGPFVPVAIIIKDIRFENFFRCAIRVYATTGDTNEISGCSFDKYLRSQFEPSPGPGTWPIVVDNVTSPTMLGGQLQIADNYFGAPPAPGTNNMIHASNCKFRQLRFYNNRITDMHWVGIAVYGNQGRTIITNNVVTKSLSYKEGAAISVGVGPSPSGTYDDDFTIEDNTVEVSSPNTHGIMAFLAKPTSPLVIRGNTVIMTPIANDTPARAAISCFGAACGSPFAKVENNWVYGRAPYGVWASDRVPPLAKQVTPPDGGTTIRDNHLENFTAIWSQVFVGQAAKRLKLLDNCLGCVEGDNRAGKLTVPVGTAEQALLHTGVYWRGSKGEISREDFCLSKIAGWKEAPIEVGCIYLDSMSEDNAVYWKHKDFPQAPGVLLPGSQIEDEGKNNHIFKSPPLTP
jgi:hypothetical protein